MEIGEKKLDIRKETQKQQGLVKYQDAAILHHQLPEKKVVEKSFKKRIRKARIREHPNQCKINSIIELNQS